MLPVPVAKLPLKLWTAVFVGIPFPETTIPTVGVIDEVMFETVELPLVVLTPRFVMVSAEAVFVDIALAEMAMLVELAMLATVAPAGIPVPVIDIPGTMLEVVPIAEMVALPLTVLPT